MTTAFDTLVMRNPGNHAAIFAFTAAVPPINVIPVGVWAVTQQLDFQLGVQALNMPVQYLNNNVNVVTPGSQWEFAVSNNWNWAAPNPVGVLINWHATVAVGNDIFFTAWDPVTVVNYAAVGGGRVLRLQF